MIAQRRRGQSDGPHGAHPQHDQSPVIASVRHSEVDVVDASIPDSGELKTGDRLREAPAWVHRLVQSRARNTRSTLLVP